MEKVRTRFAPSPTGSMHIGNLRTAFYAYAMAKHSRGEFVLRIEDTDQKREVEGGVDTIKKILKIFNVNWDEYYVQSERVKEGIYEEAAKKLVKEGHAFYCQCEGRNAKKDGFSKILRDPCRDKNLDSGAIKLKVPEGKKIKFFDFVINKEIEWDTSSVADATLLKSDGFPTYHLAVVVDDTAMKITHVIRGHDWLPSTPIHLLVYKYLGLELPQIGHPTDILDPEGGKLSKRKGSVSVEGMIKEGYLPEAILNFVILLGWAPKDNKEIFSLEEFVNEFDPKGFQKSNPVFNREKLDWFNGHYIQNMGDKELIKKLENFYPDTDAEIIEKFTPLVKTRIKKLTEFKDMISFVFSAPEVDKNLFDSGWEDQIKNALNALENIKKWSLENINNALMKVVKEKEYKTGVFFMNLRIAITGRKITPPINDSLVIIGKDETLKRLKILLE